MHAWTKVSPPGYLGPLPPLPWRRRAQPCEHMAPCRTKTTTQFEPYRQHKRERRADEPLEVQRVGDGQRPGGGGPDEAHQGQRHPVPGAGRQEQGKASIEVGACGEGDGRCRPGALGFRWLVKPEGVAGA